MFDFSFPLQKVVSFVEPHPAPSDVMRSDFIWRPVGPEDTTAPLEQARLPNRRFDISALNGAGEGVAAAKKV